MVSKSILINVLHFQMTLKKLLFLFLCTFPAFLKAQEIQRLSLDELIQIAYQNQPALNISLLEREIMENNVKSSLSGWLPQAGLDADYFRYFEQPVAIFPDFNNPESGAVQEVRTGVPFNSNLNFYINQPIVNNDLFRAKGQANPLRNSAEQSLELVKIDLNVNTSKAFFEALLSQEEIKILQEDIQRQERQLKDAKSLFEAGITDNIDFKRASITLQNSRSALFQAKEQYQISLARLKEISGIQTDFQIELDYDLNELTEKVYLDTLEGVNFDKRYETKYLLSQKSIQEAELAYARRTYLPDLNAFFNYNIIYQTLDGSQLFNTAFPNSLAGFRLAFPIFQGGRRNYQIRAADLQLKQLEVAQKELQLQVSREHQEALSAYKTYLYQWKIQEENKKTAEEIYQTISLQYEEGIKNFLEVIQAEADLRTSRINAINALFRLMASKIDLLRARGEILTEEL
ncbi:outer membrane efflux protein precursor [Indibacter alkaliphilus LW1]|uniref:Outer membrane efflux protein n=1 Tax=Indibacter alkaliphilus (strain CCUG 57479 / KCTC 22604 / LW1) TaxID=1189612 RepID=S2DQG9_INDAL|nr:TolC family protein [Indibacter alkaliphilus]EOZ92068.1 outer membrane efflux protein precursor [Indibacter alkaliphilus LW1]